MAGAHAGWALAQGDFGGDLVGRQARRKRVGRQCRKNLGPGDGGRGQGVIVRGGSVLGVDGRDSFQGSVELGVISTHHQDCVLYQPTSMRTSYPRN